MTSYYCFTFPLKRADFATGAGIASPGAGAAVWAWRRGDFMRIRHYRPLHALVICFPISADFISAAPPTMALSRRRCRPAEWVGD